LRDRSDLVPRLDFMNGLIILLSQKVADIVVLGSAPSGYGALRQFSAHRGSDGPPVW
jgi:hypothetical protein